MRKDRIWGVHLLRRAAKTVFFLLWPYHAINFVRSWAYDILALIPLATVGVWWIIAPNGSDVPADAVSTADPMQLFLLSHHVARFYPTLIAFLLCVFILRTGRSSTSRYVSRTHHN